MGLDIGTLVGFLDLDTSRWDKKTDDAEGKLSGLSGGALAVGTAVGGLLAKGLADSINIEAANDKLAAQLGLTGDQAAMYGDIAGSLYADAYGGSIEEVNTALGAVSSSLSKHIGDSEAALEGATAKAMDLAATFEIDVADAAAMVGQTLEHGLARDADHAFDLITVSMQKMPAAMRGELMPMIDEYAVHLKGMGFEGEDAFGLLVNAAQDGTYAIDKTVDAIKELAIRATDGSETTAEGFEAIGLNADDMSAKIVAGGASARQGLDEIIDGLLAMEDPSARAQAAIALFGTPVEDLAVSEIPAFLRSLKDSADVMGDTEGAADDLGKALNDNLGVKLESLKRRASMMLVDFLESPFGPWISGAALLGLGATAAVGPLTTLYGNAKTLGSTLRTGASSAYSFAGGLKGIAAVAGAATTIAAVGTAIDSYVDAEKRADMDQLANSFMANSDAMEVMSDASSGLYGDVDKLFGAFDQILQQSTVAATRFVDQIEAQNGVSDATEAMREAIEAKSAADQQATSDAEASTAATDEQAEAMGGVAASTEDAVEALQAYADQLAAQFDPMFAMIDASNQVRDARNAVTEAETALNEAIATHGQNSAEAQEAQQALTDAQIGAVEAAVGLEQAETSLAQAIASGAITVSDMEAQLDSWVAAGTITRAEADLMRDRILLFSEAVRQHPTTARTEVSAPGATSATDQVRDAARAIFGLPPSRTVDVYVNVHETIYRAARNIFPSLDGRAAGGPVRAGQAYIVGEVRPELFIPDEDGVILPEVPGMGRANGGVPGVGGAGAMGGPGGVRVAIDLSGGDRRLLDWLRGRIQVDGGGDVQRALGRP